MAHCSQDGAVADRVRARLVAGLEEEFGAGAGAALAQHFLAAEESDFLWEARAQERWLGSHESIDDDDIELDRIAICGRIDRRWFVAQLIVDGDGHAHGVLGRRDVGSAKAARKALADAH